MFEFWINSIRLYRRERFPLRMFMPVAGTLTVASLAGTKPGGIFDTLGSGAMSVLLLFQFRLWDDLADRQGDCLRHPERFLCGPVGIASLYMVVVFSGLACAAALLMRGRWLEFVLVCGAALFWYAGFSEKARHSIAGRHVLLLKYPIFVWLIAPIPSLASELIASMAIVYLCCAIYELLHDRDVRSQPLARALLVVYVCALGGIAVVVLRALGESL